MAIRVWGAGSAGGSDENWNTAANWTGDTLPGTGDTVEFDGAISNNTVSSAPSSAVTLHTILLKSNYSGTVVLGTLLSITNTLDIDTTSGGNAGGEINLIDAISVELGNPAQITLYGSIKNATVNIDGYSNYSITLLECKEENQINISNSTLNIDTTLENTLLENSTTGSEQLSWSGGDNWIGQTFTFASAQKIGAVALKGWDLPGNQDNRSKFKLEIYATSGGLPTGSPLGDSEDYIINETVPVTSTYDMWIPLKNLLSLSAGTYAFVLKPLSSFNGLVNVGVNNSNPYAGGTYVSSSDGGSSWSATSGRDMRFRVFYISLTDIVFDACNIHTPSPIKARNVSLLNSCNLASGSGPDYYFRCEVFDSIKTNGSGPTAVINQTGGSANDIWCRLGGRKIERINFVDDMSLDYEYPNVPNGSIQSTIELDSLFNILPVTYGNFILVNSSYLPARMLYFNQTLLTYPAYHHNDNSTSILYGTTDDDITSVMTRKNRRNKGGF